MVSDTTDPCTHFESPVDMINHAVFNDGNEGSPFMRALRQHEELLLPCHKASRHNELNVSIVCDGLPGPVLYGLTPREARTYGRMPDRFACFFLRAHRH
jgi:hypothetical protein